MKTILHLTLILLCGLTNTHASLTSPYPQDWTHIRTVNNYNVFHKSSYTNMVDVKGQKRLNTWAKYVAKDTRPNMFYLRKDDYLMVELQFICSKRQYAVLSGTTYWSQGRASRSSMVDEPQFNTIQPRSVEARIAHRVCSSNRA